MTAINAAIADDGQIGWLVTDTAGVGEGGTITMFADKAFVMHSQQLVFAVRGGKERALLARLGFEAFVEFDQVVGQWPAADQQLCRQLPNSPAAPFELVIVGYSNSERRVRLGYYNGSGRFEFGERFVAPSLPETVSDAPECNPDALIEYCNLQHTTVVDPDGIIKIGGTIILTTVTERQITQRRIASWRDKIGERISSTRVVLDSKKGE